MNKSEFINKVAQYGTEATGELVTKKRAKEAIEMVCGAMTEAILEERSLQLVGFGSFIVRDVPAKVCRNPQTGETINVPAKGRIKFSPCAKTKEALISK